MEFAHGGVPATGVLLANLGTPDAPTPPALKRYLAEFLWDPRVIELPRWKWWLILHLFVLTTRPRKVAEAYESIWTDEGSPLLVTARKQAQGLEERLRARFGSPVHVGLGMRYGSPSLASALDELLAKGCRRIVFVPLYPQYSATTTASTMDALGAALARRRWVPDVRTVLQYHDDAGYIRALANSVRERWAKDGEPERLLISFHGIPERYFLAGDPYHCHCRKTGRLLAEALGLAEDRVTVGFQSLFGKEEWIKPYTDATLQAWAKEDVESVDVIAPGFSADCLETLEELDVENRAYFEAGGGRYRYLPCLNDRADWLDALADLVSENLYGWAVPQEEWDGEAAAAEAAASQARAEALKRTRGDASR